MFDALILYNKILGWFGSEYIVQFIFMTLVFLPCPKRSLWPVRYFAGMAVIIVLADFVPIPLPWFYLVYFLLIAIWNAVVYKYGAIMIIFISLCMYCLQHIASSFAYGLYFVIMGMTNNGSLFWLYSFVIMPLTLFAVMAGGYFFVVRRIVRLEKIQFTNSLLIFVAVMFVIAAAMLTHWVRSWLWYSYILAALMCLNVLFAIMSMMLVFMNIKNVSLEQESIILAQMLNKDKQHYEQTKLSNEKIQIKYHDMKKLQKDGIVNYPGLSDIDGDKEILFSTYFTGNTALDVVLSEKALMCERLGIRFVCTADGSAVDFMKPAHIYSLMVNALENSIESVKALKDHREVEVTVIKKDNMCVIKTANYTEAETLEMRDGLPATTKSNSGEHGFGVKSMRNIVMRYNGSIRFFIFDHTFTMIAVIPIPVKKTA